MPRRKPRCSGLRQVSGRNGGRSTHQIHISQERIYQHVWADKHAGGTPFRQLRRTGKNYNKRGSRISGRGIIPGRIDIDQRPAVVEQRIRIGDWEADTIVGSGRKGAILSLVERVSRIHCCTSSRPPRPS